MMNPAFPPISPADNRRITQYSGFLFLVLALSLIASLFARDNRIWMDEILSYSAISTPSIARLNAYLVSGAEQTPPAFFYVYWVIGHVFSLDIVFLKGVSITLFAVTIALFYRYATRLTGRPVVNFVLISGLVALTFLNITLAVQIRSYVVLFLAGGLYFMLIHQLIYRPTNPWLLMAHMGMGLLLALTHSFGLFYLAASGTFFGLLWLWSRKAAYWYVLGTFLAILAIWMLVWYPFFIIQAKTGEAHSWIPLPTFWSFFRITGELAPTLSNKVETLFGAWPLVALLRFLLLVALWGYISGQTLRKDAKLATHDPAFMLFLMTGFLYLATVTITVIVSLLHTSVFLSRYLWPNHLLVVYLLVYACHYAGVPDLARRTIKPLKGVAWGRSAVVAFSLLVGVYLFFQSKKLILLPTNLMTYVDRLDKKTPVFLESSINFMPVWYYNRDRPIYFLLDRETAFAPNNDAGATVGYYTLLGYKKQYQVDAIMPTERFTPKQVPHFFVVDERWNYQIEHFLRNKSVKVVRTIPTDMDGFQILECVFTSVEPKQVAAGQ